MAGQGTGPWPRCQTSKQLTRVWGCARRLHAAGAGQSGAVQGQEYGERQGQGQDEGTGDGRCSSSGMCGSRVEAAAGGRGQLCGIT